ncbi:hypothetical protein [Phytoactinopolyspora halophila]|nr:hypothetical protein [Phytoactinopolyspora halophila]
MNDVIEKLRAADDRTAPPEALDVADVVRRGEARLRRRTRLWLGGVLVAVAIVAGAGSWVWPTAPDDSAAPEDTAVADRGDVEPGEYMSVFDEPQQPSDELPDEIRDSERFAAFDDDLVAETVRAVGESDDARFWAGITEDRNVCLIVDVVEGDWIMGCTGVEALGMRGGPALYQTYRASAAILVADGYTPPVVEEEGWTFISPNVAVGAPLGSRD